MGSGLFAVSLVYGGVRLHCAVGGERMRMQERMNASVLLLLLSR